MTEEEFDDPLDLLAWLLYEDAGKLWIGKRPDLDYNDRISDELAERITERMQE